ncbi:hydroxylase [Pseudonocardia sp. EC080610-09]|uniref:NAD(P)H-binding protein n=1 Tax=unclassified Pseudonocardia TaxID=2619320 RepID=UPI00070650E3|nr:MULTISPECIES: NAD(P)H-binding protein [unclassified Pseudonocardia]ALL78087.1 hydroxylase [Pseudonocardia sp. EC080610-09]ALL80998.1 hydroxylase [Pseudonocardia sp. EC080619-01]
MTILVTGATGNIGRLVVDHLIARTGEPVRALTVDPVRAALPDGVEAVRGSVRRPAALDGAFDAVRAMYLAPYEPTAAEVLAAAADAGVEHVVALTGEPDSWWGTVTKAVEAAGPAWTHLWPADFVENYEMWLPQIRATGVVREPWPALASTPTAMTDIAEVAAVALTAPGYTGRALTLTGPEPVSRRDAVAAIAEATGVGIGFEQVTPDEAVAALEPSAGRDAAEMVVHTILGFLHDAEPAPNGVVEEVTGRPATTVAAWAHSHADRLRAAIT